MNIAIFGGTFNPVHAEHINIARAAIKSLSLDKLIVMPTAVTPQKSGKMLANDSDRLHMCKLAFGDIPNVEVSSEEILSGGVSYSYITCHKFAEQYPTANRYFIVGCDMLASFDKWKNPEDILKNVTLAACAREDSGEFELASRDFYKKFGKEVVKIDYVGDKVSSTAVRVLAFAGEDISALVTEKVAQYIQINAIYYEKNIAKVKDFLKPERWAHTLRVAYMAAKNCSRIGWCERDAVTAALLHDCAKYVPLSSPYLSGFELVKGVPSPVVHQFSGAYMAMNYFGVTDNTVLNAIRYHTSARANMSEPEKLIFLCDMLEDGRSYDGVDMLREIFKSDIDKCFYTALEEQVKYLVLSRKPLYPMTLEALNYERSKNI